MQAGLSSQQAQELLRHRIADAVFFLVWTSRHRHLTWPHTPATNHCPGGPYKSRRGRPEEKPVPTLGASRTKLREILTAQIGLEPEVIDGAGNASLTDLGVDSIGVIELEKAVLDEYGVDLPDETPAMTIGQIIDYIDATARSAS